MSEQGYRNLFYDGKSAKAHEVSVALQNGKIILSFKENSQNPLSIKYEEIEAIQKPIDNREGVFAFASIANARLLVEDVNLYKKIKKEIPLKVTGKKHAKLFTKIFSVFFLLGFTGLATWFYSPKIASLIPKKFEQQLGDEAYQFFLTISNKCETENEHIYLQESLDKLTKNLNSKWQYKVTVLDLPIKNVVSLPGGYIIIFKDAMKLFKSEEELFGVLAHEVAHIEKQHALQRVITQNVLDLAIRAMFGGSFNIANSLISNQYSQKKETEADLWAVDYLQQQNINPNGLASFLKNVENSYKNNKPEESNISDITNLFLSHPASQERIKLIQENIIDKHKSYKKIIIPSKWKALQNICKDYVKKVK